MIIAAGSVMKDPSTGAIVRTASHHASGVRPPSAATRPITPSANSSTGRVEATAMITATNMGSVKSTPWAMNASAVAHPRAKVMAASRGITQTPKTTSTSPRKWSSSALASSAWLGSASSGSPGASALSPGRRWCPPRSRWDHAVIRDAAKVCRIANANKAVATRFSGSTRIRWASTAESDRPSSLS